MAQAMVEDSDAVTNLMMANSTITEKVVLYTNRLSTKEADTMALQTDMENLLGEVKNLKAKVATLKRSYHYGRTSTNKHRRGRTDTK